MVESILSIIKSHTIFALIGTFACLMAAFTAQYGKKIAAKRLKKQKEAMRKNIAALSQDLGLLEVSRSAARPPVDTEQSSGALLQEIGQQILERMSAVPLIMKEQVREDTAHELREFSERLEKSVARLPEDAERQKIASIHHAILSERIDQLSRRIDTLENRILSHWDVAITVSTITGGIFAVIAATSALITFVADSAR